jgi:hypothetical protein
LAEAVEPAVKRSDFRSLGAGPAKYEVVETFLLGESK